MAKIVRLEPIHVGWSRFSEAVVQLDDGQEIRRYIEDHGNAAAVLPYDPVRRVALLVRQVRAPVLMAGDPPFPEPPAGLIDPGEDPADCARRETLEETGRRLKGPLDPVGGYWSSPGVTTERTWLFLAAYGAADQVGEGGGTDADEQVETLELPLAELAARLDRGELHDLKLALLVSTLMRKRPELFEKSPFSHREKEGPAPSGVGG